MRPLALSGYLDVRLMLLTREPTMTFNKATLNISLILMGLGLSACGGDTNFSHQDDELQPVTGNAIAEFSATELRWDDIEMGQTISRELTISSMGEVDLEFYDARVIIGSSTFYLPDEWRSSRTVASGSDITLLLTASIEEPLVEGILRVKCNDVDQVEFEIPLIATGTLDTSDSGLTVDSGL